MDLHQACEVGECKNLHDSKIYWTSACLSMNVINIKVCQRHRGPLNDLLTYITRLVITYNMVLNLPPTYVLSPEEINAMDWTTSKLSVTMLTPIKNALCHFRNDISSSVRGDFRFQQIDVDIDAIKENIDNLWPNNARDGYWLG